MARIRSVKPEFWADEKLSPLDDTTRLVFLGLISMADDAGRMVDSVKQIDAFIFPHSDSSSREALAKLAGIGRIVRGKTVSGQSVIQIANWGRHQRVDHPNMLAALPEIVVTMPLSAIPETFTTDSREIPEPLATRSTIYDQDQRSTITSSTSPRARDARVEEFLEMVTSDPAAVEFLDEFDGVFRASQFPSSQASEFKSMLAGLNMENGRPATLAALGQSIRDMRNNGVPFNSQTLRVYAAKLLRPKTVSRAPVHSGPFVRPERKSPGQEMLESVARVAAEEA